MAWFKRKQDTGSPSRRVITRSFAAAETSRLLASWKVDCGFTAREISSQLEVIRGRSRQEAKDNPHMRKFLNLVATNVVGENGFRLKSKPHDVRPRGVVLDASAAKFIEWHWRKFCTYRDPGTTSTWFDLTGIKTAADMDTLNAKTWAKDGEYFIEVVYTAANPYGIAFRCIRPDYCNHKYNVDKTSTGTRIEAGVEKDATTGRPVAYWFYSTTTSPHACYGGKPMVRIPASRIIHGFIQEDEGQPRGVPWAHAVMVKLKMLAEYDLAEMTAARDEACTVWTYEAGESSDPEDIVDLTDPDNKEAANVLMQEKSPGQTEITPRGYTLKSHTPQHPNRELTAFKNSMLRDISTGLLVEYANFTNDWAGVSFSSVRAGTISERDMWKCVQAMMISQCKQVQFLLWLKSFLSLSVSGGLPMSKIEKFSEHEFSGRRWMWVDPVRDMNAALMAEKQQWKTAEDNAADLGYDFYENLEKAKREADAREAAGFDRYGNSEFAPVGKEAD
jgi:lambda family phage portal protein